MDIQVSSNFERFIYFMEGENSEKVCRIMEGFKRTGKWTFDNFSAKDFSASRMDDAGIASKIKELYTRYGEVVDPHTACGFADISHDGTKIILSTASPAKFPELIEKTISVKPTASSLECLLDKPIINKKMPADTQKIRDYISANGIK